ncbi:MAG: hypothetical protein U9N85_00050 [Bacteroidota bacterium]|nr:hypothetical protein [Bacteroidota bacterium]
MKKLFIGLAMLSILFATACKINRNTANGDGSVSEVENVFKKGQIVYWFYVKPQIKRHKDTKIEKLTIRYLGDRIYAGTIDEYDIKLWENLSNGSKFAIGPFAEYDEAEDAVSFYNLKDTTGIDPRIDQNNNIFYFPLEIYIRERSHSYGLERIPGAMFPSSYKNFNNYLHISLSQKRITIGPFRDRFIAEEAKRRYRLH